MSFLITIVFALFSLVSFSQSSDNGLGATPPMGWNTWCTLAACYQQGSTENLHDYCYEAEVKDVALEMMKNGMQEAGYNYINLDDCWGATERDAQGRIQPDPERFPSGIQALTEWLHQRKFLFGLYTSAGVTTCSSGGRPKSIPGSYGHYEDDAQTFANWNVDYVKLDWCDTKFPNGTDMDQQTQTTQFWNAMNKTGRPMWLNFHCGHPPQEWCAHDGNSFRIGTDHHDIWSNTERAISELKGQSKGAGIGHWNDADFLITGGAGCDKNVTGLRCPGQTDDEYRSVFALWSIAQSALIVASDVRNMSAIQKEILLNTEIIKINQDTKYAAGDLTATTSCATGVNCEIWSKKTSDEGYGVVLFNPDSDAHVIEFDFEVIGEKGMTLKVRDLWKHSDLGSFSGSFKTPSSVPPHGNMFLKVTK